MGTIVTETNMREGSMWDDMGTIELAMVWVESYQPYLSFTTVEFTLKTSGNPLPPRS